jgi:imidazolonepropionase
MTDRAPERGLLVVGAAEIATLAGGVRRGAAQADVAARGKGHAIAILDERIVAVGPRPDVEAELRQDGHDPASLEVLDAAGGTVTPGLIDPHTHLMFAGTRERELELRQRGAGYLEILEAGGGILSSVASTRGASEEELERHGRRWLREFLRHGVTTVEAKTGYGLDTESETRALRVLAALGADPDRQPVEVVPTFLGAHAVSPELRGQPDAVDRYVDVVIGEQLPAVAEQGIARFCDVFCEEGVFSAAQSRRVLEAGARLGLRSRLHADELRPSGGAQLAAEIGAAAADHLAAIDDTGIEALAAAAERDDAVVATLLPATTLFLMSSHYAPARRLIDAGIPVALGTDFNPGTSPTPNLALVLSLAVLQLKLTPSEAVAAVTINAARALGLEATHGSIEAGKQADLVVWDVPSHDLIPYWVGADLVGTVVKRGRVVS